MSRRIVVASGVLVLVVVCIVIAILVRTRPSAPITPTPSPSSSVKPTQATMLVGVRGDDGQTAGAVLMGTQREPATGSWVSLAPGLSLDVGTGGTITLANEGPWDPADSARQVGNQLGVRVDGGFVMDRLAFAAMVDAVGGVTVTVKTAVIVLEPDGTRTVVARPGKRTLDGPTAALYVVTLSPGEDQTARMARFDDVWEQVLLQLPGNVDRVRSIIGSLGALSRISLSPEVIAENLLNYQTAMADFGVQRGTVPVRTAGTGGKEIFQAEPAGTEKLARQLFGNALLVPGQNGVLPRIRVVSAGVPSETAVRIRETLTANGYGFVWGGYEARSATSTVTVPAAADRVSLGDPVATLLGLPVTAVKVDPAGSIGVQAQVAAGRDVFTPPRTNSPTPSR